MYNPFDLNGYIKFAIWNFKVTDFVYGAGFSYNDVCEAKNIDAIFTQLKKQVKD